MQLILVRHAESEAGQHNIIAGADSCTGLTPHGRLQAQALAARFASRRELGNCHALLSSPLLRARQTADLLSGTLNAGDAKEIFDLCELQPGDADGLTADEAHAKHGRVDMLEFPDRPFAPNGESWNAFRNRVNQCLDHLEERFQGETVVAVTHSGFVVASIIAKFGIPRPGTGAQLHPVHTSLTEWQVTANIWQLIRYNDTNHLLGGRR